MEDYLKLKIPGVIIIIISFIILLTTQRGLMFLFNLALGPFCIIVGFLFVIGPNEEITRKMIKAAFIFGLIIWSILLIGPIYNIYFYQYEIELASTIFIILSPLASDIIHTIIIIGTLFAFTYRYFNELNYYIFRIILNVSLYIVGAISFFKARQKEVHFEVVREAAYIIPIEKSRIEEDLKNICPNCYETIKEGAKFCVHCGLKINICQICHNYIKNEEKTAICPFCKTIFHKIEFLEWIKVKATCPVCKNEIDLWEFQKLDKK